MPAPVSPPDLSPTQLRLYRSQPQRTTLLWVVLVVVVAIAMLAPVVLSKATPSTRQATAPLVVSDPLAGSELHLADRECPVDALALTGQGWNCPGLHIEAITTPHAGDPDLALRRMFRFITRTDLPEGDILREGDQRLLIEPNGRGIAMSTSAMGASQVIVFRGLISENLDIITSSWREISGNELPEIVHELAAMGQKTRCRNPFIMLPSTTRPSVTRPDTQMHPHKQSGGTYNHEQIIPLFTVLIHPGGAAIHGASCAAECPRFAHPGCDQRRVYRAVFGRAHRGGSSHPPVAVSRLGARGSGGAVGCGHQLCIGIGERTVDY